MELKDFVKETLSQIVAGVEAAQTEVRDCGGLVNPAYRPRKKEPSASHFGELDHGQNIFLIDFDVAVTVLEESGTEAKVKLNVVSLLGLGAGGESSNSNSATNKISFKVPLALPVDSVSTEKLKERDKIIEEKRRKQTEEIRQANQNGRKWVIL